MAVATYGHAVQAASLWLDPSHRYEDRENDLGSPLRYCADERSLWHSVDAADNYRHPEQWRLCGYGQRSDFHCGRDGRSEEHTSELQSLMRISYAVFCLKKKTTITLRIMKTLEKI